MCFSAIPGQNGRIRAIRVSADARPVKAVSPPPSPAFLCAATVPVCSGLLEPISWDRIPYSCSRRKHRRDSLRGKRTAKCMHKPCWRGYEKF